MSSKCLSHRILSSVVVFVILAVTVVEPAASFAGEGAAQSASVAPRAYLAAPPSRTVGAADTSPAAVPQTILMRTSSFSPASLTIQAGDTVQWVNSA